ncbi:MAG: SulP family inorganic anion transporter [Anaerolineales bacterium]|nr:SulP family inorganic anion transporter [Anaerolineales bacterium]
MSETLQQNIDFHHIVDRGRLYLTKNLRFDLMAGLTVAMIAIPQTMAYAAIIGVNPIYGLYTAIISGMVGAFFGRSSYLVTGSTNAVALATAGVLFGYHNSPIYPEYVFTLAIISGVIKLLLGVLQLGGMVRYISNSVLTGFLAGAGVLIIINQLGNLVGVRRPAGADPLQILWNLATHVRQFEWHIVVIGAITIVVFLLLKRLNSKLPAALLAIVLASGLVQFFGWHAAGVTLVSDLGDIDKVGLRFHLPQIPLDNLQSLFVSGGAVALLSLVETMSVAKALGLNHDEKVYPSREFFGQGLASIATGLFQGVPSSGSPSRSAINADSGARTRLAAGFSGIFVLVAVLAFSGLIGYIPVASLAGVVVVSAYNMIDWRHIKLTWQSRTVSRFVLIVTFASALLLPLHIAIYMGAALSIVIYLRESSSLELSYLKLNQQGEFEEHNLADIEQEHPSIAIVNIEGALYFGAVDDLEERLEEIMVRDVRVVILRMRRMRLLASTGVTTLKTLVTRAEHMGTSVVICGVPEEINATLESSGITALVGEQRVFPANDTLFSASREALSHARMIVVHGSEATD